MHGLQIKKVYAVDIEPNLPGSSNIEIIKADLNNMLIPLPSNSVDLIDSLETIEHLVNPATFLK